MSPHTPSLGGPLQYALELQTERIDANSALPDEETERQRLEARLRRVLRRKQERGDLAGMAACFIHLGDLLLAAGRAEEAGEMYRQALHLSREAHEARRQRAVQG
jgi:tetratricopeptide (TPR) repeat protein